MCDVALFTDSPWSEATIYRLGEWVDRLVREHLLLLGNLLRVRVVITALDARRLECAHCEFLDTPHVIACRYHDFPAILLLVLRCTSTAALYPVVVWAEVAET